MSSELPPVKRWPWTPWLILWAALLAVIALTVAVPAVNEPHYLTKARHFWQPDWCAGDLFLESADAHFAFFATFGPLAASFGFESATWIGRVVGAGLFAAGWLRLGAAIGLRPLVSGWAAGLFLLLQSLGNFSGEWVLGGIEGKVIAYGCLLWSVASWLENRRVPAALWLGLAITWHPVVGMWATLAALGSGGTLWLLGIRQGFSPASHSSRELLAKAPLDTRRHLQFLAAAGQCLCVAIAAAPGLWPVVQLLREPADARTQFAGTYLQVFYRLAHHLDPMKFHVRSYLGYGVLVAVWLLGLFVSQRISQQAINSTDSSTNVPALVARRNGMWWLQGIVAWAIVFALVGVAVGYGPRPPDQMPGFTWRMKLLKFYPFRLADAVLPMSLAWMAACGWDRLLLGSGLPQFRRWSMGALVGLFLILPVVHRWQWQPAAVSPDQQSDWIEVCRWIRAHVPTDSLFQTPHGRFTFKWYAERPEYVCYKDCPQDVTGIAEWNRRMQFLGRWYQDHFQDGVYSADDMASLHRETGITHLVTDRLGPIELVPIHQHGGYRVYVLNAPSNRPHPEPVTDR